jgi:hypothetical protein
MALTTDRLKNIHPKQKIFVLPPAIRHRDKVELIRTKVSRVGTKFFYTDDGRKWELESGKNVSEFAAAELFATEEEYINLKESKELWEGFYRKLSHRPPAGVTLDEIKKVIEIIEKK